MTDREGRVALDVQEPRGVLGRIRGLLGERGLPPATGVLLRAKSVHTLGMLFTIDAVYLRRDGTVLRAVTLPPGRVGPLVLRARWVLELAGGEAARLGIAPGMALAREPR